jgi:hypothetical protein
LRRWCCLWRRKRKAPCEARKKVRRKVDGLPGPLGAIVGGAIGAAAGTVGGILGVDDRPRFREYVVRERRPSYRYKTIFASASCCRRAA